MCSIQIFSIVKREDTCADVYVPSFRSCTARVYYPRALSLPLNRSNDYRIATAPSQPRAGRHELRDTES